MLQLTKLVPTQLLVSALGASVRSFVRPQVSHRHLLSIVCWHIPRSAAFCRLSTAKSSPGVRPTPPVQASGRSRCIVQHVESTNCSGKPRGNILGQGMYGRPLFLERAISMGVIECYELGVPLVHIMARGLLLRRRVPGIIVPLVCKHVHSSGQDDGPSRFRLRASLATRQSTHLEFIFC